MNRFKRMERAEEEGGGRNSDTGGGVAESMFSEHSYIRRHDVLFWCVLFAMAKCSVSAHWLSALGNKEAVKGAGNDLRNLHNVCRNSPRRRRQPPRGGS